jgi:hypothetical protein
LKPCYSLCPDPPPSHTHIHPPPTELKCTQETQEHSPGAEQHGVILSHGHVGQGQGLRAQHSIAHVSVAINNPPMNLSKTAWALHCSVQTHCKAGAAVALSDQTRHYTDVQQTMHIGEGAEGSNGGSNRGSRRIQARQQVLTSGAGPRIFLPVESYWEPWHGHLNLFSACTGKIRTVGEVSTLHLLKFLTVLLSQWCYMLPQQPLACLLCCCHSTTDLWEQQCLGTQQFKARLAPIAAAVLLLCCCCRSYSLRFTAPNPLPLCRCTVRLHGCWLMHCC